MYVCPDPSLETVRKLSYKICHQLGSIGRFLPNEGKYAVGTPNKRLMRPDPWFVLSHGLFLVMSHALFLATQTSHNGKIAYGPSLSDELACYWLTAELVTSNQLKYYAFTALFINSAMDVSHK